MLHLELLAPARTAEIGMAAIDCGADAVYIAGPSFGARAAAGNSVEDIARLCEYAHQYGVRIYVTVNTILYEHELEPARKLVLDLVRAGVDALIIQDPAVMEMARGLRKPDGTPVALHASTQCAIRTPEKARFIESLGYGRLVLERQLSLAQIKDIRKAVEAEIEFFVHGALCVCYSGECYLSEYLTGRSANRGECAQACRSRYDLTDASGKVLLKDKALLSLKDYNLLNRLEELADAGVCSFKIEGRLKGEPYVRNVVRAYDQALNTLVARHPDKYARSSFGRVRGGFTPDLEKTFNRGYTELFINGTRGRWSSMDVPTHLGEYVGEVARLTRDGLVLKGLAMTLSNGDGFAFRDKADIVGFRASVADGLTLKCQRPEGLRVGTKLYRNISANFLKHIDAAPPIREMDVSVHVALAEGTLSATAVSEDGREVTLSVPATGEPARDHERMLSLVAGQIGKRSGHYSFDVIEVDATGDVPMIPAAFLNGVRRDLASALDAVPVHMVPLRLNEAQPSITVPSQLSYKANIANSIDRSVYKERGAQQMEQAYELCHKPGAELMRSRYCVRYELGLCPRIKKGVKPEPLYLLNSGKRLRLDFHCAECEMTVSEA